MQLFTAWFKWNGKKIFSISKLTNISGMTFGQSESLHNQTLIIWTSVPPCLIGFSRNEHIEVELERLLQVCWLHVHTLLLQKNPIPPLPQQLCQIPTNATSYVKVSAWRTPSNAHKHSKSNALSLKACLHILTLLPSNVYHSTNGDGLSDGKNGFQW